MMQKKIGGRAAALIGSVVVATAILVSPAAVGAKDGDIIRTGSCSSATDWKLKLSPEDGRIEVEFEVDQNRNGETWNVKLRRDGNVFWRGQRTTKAPSGSFEVRQVASNGTGPDVFVARARNPRTDEVCRGVATFG
jgi:hypothetical protein